MGASSDEKKIGGRPIFYLKHYNFEGEIYPINPNYDEIQDFAGRWQEELLEKSVEAQEYIDQCE